MITLILNSQVFKMNPSALGITIRDIEAAVNQNQLNSYLNINLSKNNKARADQIENKALNENQCGDVGQLFNRLNQLDPAVVQNFVQNDFYDEGVMHAFSCLIQSVWTAKDAGLSPHWRIRQWIQDLNYVARGVFGITFSAVFEALNSPGVQSRDIIVKTSLIERVNLNHETFVGLYATNKLRSSNPGFAYSYGGFNCSSAYASGGSVKTWCQASCSDASLGQPCPETVSYSLSERIVPGKTFRDTIATLTNAKQFYTLYLQVLLSLQNAYESCSFTHYDLHGENVLMRDLGAIKRIDYQLKSETYTISNSVIPTIIDMGLAYVKIDRETFPGYHETIIGVLGSMNRPFPLRCLSSAGFPDSLES